VEEYCLEEKRFLSKAKDLSAPVRIVRDSVAYNFENGNNKMKLLTEYESASQPLPTNGL
jgi:hypothetical protein